MQNSIRGEICLLNDSFPPILDGVANAVVNYANNLPKYGFYANVITPEYPDSDDSGFSFPVYRYPSIDLRNQIGYTAGIPFDPLIQLELKNHPVRLVHSHCPAVSNVFACQLRETLKVPFVMTYHTKFDVDISNAIHSKLLQEGAIKALVSSVSECDELWVVSRGAGENIRSLGYTGDYIVMNNGVDIPKQRSSDSDMQTAVSGYDLPESLPTFLFVGRLMWYKGIRIIADALAALKYEGFDFRMVFIGSGSDEKDIRSYIAELHLDDKCFFTGPIRDRNILSAWYTKADLLLFPSTFDTNGLVVREAAACSLGSVLVENSCAAEGTTHQRNAILIQDNAASLAVSLAMVMNDKEKMKTIGEHAAEDLYLSWEDAVGIAAERYEVVIDNYHSGKYKKKNTLSDDFFALQASLLDLDVELDKSIKKISKYTTKHLMHHYTGRKRNDSDRS